MLEIWWIRHASTAWNGERRWQGHTDVPLDEVGREQSRLLAGRLQGVTFDSVWSSDLGRSVETARLALPGAEVRLDLRLRELPMGHLEGRTWDEVDEAVRAEVEAWWDDPFGRPFPGGPESLGDVAVRAAAWQAELGPTGRVAAFTHGGVIRCVLWALTGPPIQRSWSVELANTSITRIRVGARSAALLSVNDAAHLERAPGVRIEPQDLP